MLKYPDLIQDNVYISHVVRQATCITREMIEGNSILTKGLFQTAIIYIVYVGLFGKNADLTRKCTCFFLQNLLLSCDSGFLGDGCIYDVHVIVYQCRRYGVLLVLH